MVHANRYWRNSRDASKILWWCELGKGSVLIPGVSKPVYERILANGMDSYIYGGFGFGENSTVSHLRLYIVYTS
jgi:hypothetical protein